jgi:predicted aspartyl protease
MGRVVVTAKIENLGDVYAAHRKYIAPTDIRWAEIDDALVDTGATGLGLPKKLIRELGLNQTGVRRVNTAKGTREAKVYEAVRLTVQGRDCVLDVTEVGANCPVLIGQLALEAMDFVVDPRGQRLIGNPAHGGQQMYDLY